MRKNSKEKNQRVIDVPTYRGDISLTMLLIGYNLN